MNIRCRVCESSNIKILMTTRYPEFDYNKPIQFFKCNTCNFIFNDLSKNILEMLYHKYYYYNRSKKHELQKAQIQYERIKKWIDINENIIEIGCGKGYLLNQLKWSGHKVHGVDSSIEAINYMKNKFCIDGSTTIDFLDKYDIVLSMDSLEHFRSPDNFMVWVEKLIKKDGYLIIDTPNGDSPNIPILKESWAGFNPFHVNIYSINNLNILFKKYGFSIEHYFSYGNNSKVSLKYRLKPILSKLHIIKPLYNILLFIKKLVSLTLKTSESHFLNQGDNLVIVVKKDLD